MDRSRLSAGLPPFNNQEKLTGRGNAKRKPRPVRSIRFYLQVVQVTKGVPPNNQEQNSWLTLLEGEMQKGNPGEIDPFTCRLCR